MLNNGHEMTSCQQNEQHFRLSTVIAVKNIAELLWHKFCQMMFRLST
jgi:hypothetical protein